MNSLLRNAALGLAAGFVGTVVMTFGQKAEQALTGRPDSTVPAQAVEALAGAEVASQVAERRLSTLAHFAYGTALGLGLAALDDVDEPARAGFFLLAAQGTGMALLQALDLDGEPSEWDAAGAAVDVAHHVVYAAAAAAAYAAMQQLFAER